MLQAHKKSMETFVESELFLTIYSECTRILSKKIDVAQTRTDFQPSADTRMAVANLSSAAKFCTSRELNQRLLRFSSSAIKTPTPSKIHLITFFGDLAEGLPARFLPVSTGDMGLTTISANNSPRQQREDGKRWRKLWRRRWHQSQWVTPPMCEIYLHNGNIAS